MTPGFTNLNSRNVMNRHTKAWGDVLVHHSVCNQTPNLMHVGFCEFGVRMQGALVVLSTACKRVFHVLRVVAFSQVSRIDARRVVAGMKNAQQRVSPMSEEERIAVGSKVLTVDRETSIAGGYFRPSPEPTAIRFMNELPKALFNRKTSSMRVTVDVPTSIMSVAPSFAIEFTRASLNRANLSHGVIIP